MRISSAETLIYILVYNSREIYSGHARSRLSIPPLNPLKRQTIGRASIEGNIGSSLRQTFARLIRSTHMQLPPPITLLLRSLIAKKNRGYIYSDIKLLCTNRLHLPIDYIRPFPPPLFTSFRYSITNNSGGTCSIFDHSF